MLRYLSLLILSLALCGNADAQVFEQYIVNSQIYRHSAPKGFTIINGNMFFISDQGLMIKKGGNGSIDSLGGGGGSMLAHNGHVYFFGGQGLGVSDGTLAGTIQSLTNIPLATDLRGFGVSNFVPYNGKVYFTADSTAHNLWATDGTVAGTARVKDFGAKLAYPSEFTEYNGLLYFKADSSIKSSLWVTDGAGTVKFPFSYTGSYYAKAFKLKRFYGMLCYIVTDTAYHSQLWITDGTATGNRLLFDLDMHDNTKTINFLTTFNGSLYFTASTVANGKELWVTDGTAAGTHMVKDINPGPGDGVFDVTTLYNGKLYFGAQHITGNSELWVTDGTAAGTQLVKDFNSITGISPEAGILFHNKMYFNVFDFVYGGALWVTDGTAAGTKLVAPANGGVSPFKAGSPVVYRDKLYFVGGGGYSQLFVIDSTDVAAYIIAPPTEPTLPPFINSAAPVLYSFDSSLYFGANYVIRSNQLWSYTDTTAKPVQVKAIAHKDGVSIYPNPNKGSFTVKLSAYNGAVTNTLTVYDITGKLVHSQTVTGAITQIHTGNLLKGIYELKLLQGDVVSTHRIVVE